MRSSRIAVVGLILALIGAGSIAYFHLVLFVPRVLDARARRGLGGRYALGNDFYPVWLTARECLPRRCDPYSAEMTRKIQTGLFGRALDANIPTDPPTDYRSLAYPAFADIVFAPAAVLDFPALRIVLAVVLPLLTTCSLGLWMLALNWRPTPIALAVMIPLALCNYPVLEALFAEQPGLIVGFFLAGAALALHRNRPLLAGILMALTTIKPQMTVLAIMYLLMRAACEWNRSEAKNGRSFIAGFFATLALLMPTSLLLWPHWIGSWLGVVFGYHRYATPQLVSDLLGPVWGPRLGPLLIAALLVFAITLAWRNRRAALGSNDFWLTFTILLAITSVAILPGQAVYDHVILFPGILLLIRHWRDRPVRRAFRGLQVIAAITLLWPLVTAFALVVARAFLPANTVYSEPLLTLPFRTALSLPFAVLALLAMSLRNRQPERASGLVSV